MTQVLEVTDPISSIQQIRKPRPRVVKQFAHNLPIIIGHLAGDLKLKPIIFQYNIFSPFSNIMYFSHLFIPNKEKSIYFCFQKWTWREKENV